MATRVLHILGTSSREGAGIARIVMSLAAAAEARYSIEALFLGGDGYWVNEFERAGIRAASVDLRAGVLPAARLIRTVRAARPAIVHQHAGGARMRAAIRYLTRARVLQHLHGSVDEASMRISDRIDVSSTDVVVACCEDVARRVVHPRCRTIYSGVRVGERAARNPSGAPVIGAAGRLVPVKGYACLIEAFARVLRDFPSARLEILGEGPERAALQAQAERLGCAHALQLPGWRDDFPNVGGGWDVFVLPSLAEALPIALLEAMAVGLPAVASNVGGVPEVLDSQSGRMVPAGDSAAFAGALRDLLASSELRVAMGREASRIVRERFSAHRMVEQMNAVYAELALDGAVA